MPIQFGRLFLLRQSIWVLSLLFFEIECEFKINLAQFWDGTSQIENYGCAKVNPLFSLALFFTKSFSFSCYFLASWPEYFLRFLNKRKLHKNSLYWMFFRSKCKVLTVVFCYQNCSDLLWEKNIFQIEKTFEITRPIYF